MRRHLAAVALAAALSSRTALAQSDASAVACIEANADAQKLERAGKLRDAAAKLVWCASASCPAAVRSDCAAILARVTASEPTVAVEVRDEAGAPTSRARVLIDGEERTEAEAGRAVVVDPGAHTIRAALRGASKELRVVVVEGEKDRRVAFDFTRAPPTRFTVPWLAWALAGVSVVATGGFVYFGLTGDGIKSRLDGTCAPTRSCSPSDYFDMKTSYDAANVLAAVAGGSLALAVLTAIVWPRPKHRAVSVGIDGLGFAIQGEF